MVLGFVKLPEDVIPLQHDPVREDHALVIL